MRNSIKKTNPLVSVIVPNYNHDKYLKQRLDCVFNQTYTNFEVILLDDCSSDESQSILLQYSRNLKVSHCIFNDTNSGNTFLQWEKGIALAKGEFIWIAESDDFCELNFLEEVSKPLIEDENVVLSYCQSNRVNENGDVTGNWKTHTNNFKSSFFDYNFILDGNTFIEEYLIYKNVIPNASAAIIRRDKVLELGLDEINSNLKYCGDWLFYFKILLGSKVGFKSKALNSFRYHSGSVIAGANKKENIIELSSIDIKLRQKMQYFLKKRKLLNTLLISKNLKKIINELKYEKSIFLYKNKHYFQGSILIFSILFNFTKRFKLKNVFFRG